MRPRPGSIIVSRVRDLEEGDLIALEFSGVVMSGKIKSIPKTNREVTPEQVRYLATQHVYLHAHGELGGDKYQILFGDFSTVGVEYKHVFLAYDRLVSVFPTTN